MKHVLTTMTQHGQYLPKNGHGQKQVRSRKTLLRVLSTQHTPCAIITDAYPDNTPAEVAAAVPVSSPTPQPAEHVYELRDITNGMQHTRCSIHCSIAPHLLHLAHSCCSMLTHCLQTQQWSCRRKGVVPCTSYHILAHPHAHAPYVPHPRSTNQHPTTLCPSPLYPHHHPNNTSPQHLMPGAAVKTAATVNTAALPLHPCHCNLKPAQRMMSVHPHSGFSAVTQIAADMQGMCLRAPVLLLLGMMTGMFWV